MGRIVVWTAVSLLVAGLALAEMPAVGDRLINQPTPATIGPATFELVFTHRFSETINDAGGTDLLGFDSAADIGIGMTLGLGRDWQVEVVRSSFLKEWEAAAKWTLLRQGDEMPIGLAARAGADYRGASGLTDRWSGFVQVVASRRITDDLDLFVVPAFASDTPTVRNAFNVAVGAAWHLPRKWDLEAEVVPANRDARDGTTAWAVAINKRVGGHAFLIYLGNSRATTVDLTVGSDYPGGFRTGDVRVGFNLLRRFPE